ncbi:MAG TPA: DUF2254 domain-containing protein [Terriglobales bacterium]|jgi:uncharacterized membrane protein|nr:DUF2254 domain-containing protein [Terriglobales bacterium]
MQALSHRHAFGEFFWWIPMGYAFAALAFGMAFPRLEARFFPGLSSSLNASSATAIFSSVASGMMALTGIVFSLAFVMMQFNATAYSPRLVLWLSRDPFVFHAIGVFTATFVYALAALAWVDRNHSGNVPLLTAWCVVFLVIASVMVLARLVQRLALLKISNVLAYVGRTGRQVIIEMYPLLPVEADTAGAADPGLQVLPKPGPIRQTLCHRGAPKMIGALDLAALVRLASQAGAMIEMSESVGEAAMDGAPLLHVRGGQAVIPEASLRQAIFLGPERTFEQDPKYAIRLLVDIAIKALSPAVNDPTTAVQALDYIEDLLRCLGHRRLQAGRLYDEAGTLRLTFPCPRWQDFVSLALEEIRYYGAGSVQVMRRMRALLRDVIADVPPERQAALRVYLDRVDTGVNRGFALLDDRRSASMEDRQGLGMARQ